MKDVAIPASFWWRRLHSLAGFALALYVAFHLFTNSQAALWIGDDGASFIESVNKIHEIPYLLLVEIAILAIPILIHAALGIRYLRTGEMNSFGGDGRSPYLPEYGRNHAYTWQRITSWILLVGILFHVVHMRFIEQPRGVLDGLQRHYIVRLEADPGLPTLAARLNVVLLGQGEKKDFDPEIFFPALEGILAKDERVLEQRRKEMELFQGALRATMLRAHEVVAIAKDFGTAELLMVRDAFKSLWMMLFYTIFVFAACFHAFNGLWTFLIAWGVTLTLASQRFALYLTTAIMFLVCLFGLFAIYGTYWINLRQ